MTRFLLCAAIFVAASALPAWGELKPQEVLVVANQASPDSVELAKLYMKQRAIPEGNLVLVKTSTSYEIPYDDYEAQIRKPIADALKERKLDGAIRSVCVIYGVPVRIGPGSSGLPPDILKATLEKAHYRLAAAYELSGSVGKSVPASMPADLRPLAKMFDTSPRVAIPPPQKPDELLAKLPVQLKTRLADVAAITDKAKKTAAGRQLMALHLEVYGLDGLTKLLAAEAANLPGAPDPDQLQEALVKTTADLGKLTGQLTAEQAKQKVELVERAQGLAGLFGLSGTQMAGTAVDSNLALLLWSADDLQKMRTAFRLELPGAKAFNSLHWEVFPAGVKLKSPSTLMVARLDGPSKQTVERMINDSVAAEKAGLKGTLYIDAGVKSVSGNKAPMYGEYDLTLQKLHSFATTNAKLKSVLDVKESLFPDGSCPDTALYVGWYSLKKYVPAFKFNQGAVAYHVASYEAMDLRDPKSQAWCTQILLNGAAATIGAVDEPYLDAFPLCNEFFPLLLTGKYTLAECYWRTVRWTNWRMILIGDPLYNPFANNKQVDVDVLRAKLAL